MFTSFAGGLSSRHYEKEIEFGRSCNARPYNRWSVVLTECVPKERKRQSKLGKGLAIVLSDYKIYRGRKEWPDACMMGLIGDC